MSLDDLIDATGPSVDASPVVDDETPEVIALRASLGLDRCRYKPFPHQVIGINALVTHPFFALFDEMGAGKTIQTIVAACILFSRGVIDRVLVVAPAAIRSVWFDPELGEITKHLFTDMSAHISLYHSKVREWEMKPEGKPAAHSEWIITNYELLRSKDWLANLLPFVTSKTLLVLDESSAVKTWNAEQTKAVRNLRKRVARCVMLNGTPIANNPLDMYSQGNILHPSILSCPFITEFKARYAEMGGYTVTTKWGKRIPTQIVRWKNLDDLTNRFAPYVLRRLKKDCLSFLPGKLPPVTVAIPLTTATWDHYRAMRDDMVTWLSSQDVVQASLAITKGMRLAQITSGFLGGVERLDEEPENPDVDAVPAWMQPSSLFDAPAQPSSLFDAPRPHRTEPVQPISREKLDALVAWTKVLLESDPTLKLVVFCRFKPELFRAVEEFRVLFPSMDIGALYGGQKKAEEQHAIRLMDLRSAPEGAATLFTTSKGAMGFTFVASHTVARMSRDFSLWKWLQSDDRFDRPGQTSKVSYTDFIATGPKGQKTVDFHTLQVLLGKLNVAEWTTAGWVRALTEE